MKGKDAQFRQETAEPDLFLTTRTVYSPQAVIVRPWLLGEGRRRVFNTVEVEE
jgi:hypothetical protein